MRENWKKLCVYAVTVVLIASSITEHACAGKKGMSVKLNKSRKTLCVGEKVKLKATIRRKRKKTRIIWKSSNPKIASVTAKGIVKGKKTGKVRIRAQIRGKKIKAVCIVTVKKKAVKKNTAKTSPKPLPTARGTTTPKYSAAPVLPTASAPIIVSPPPFTNVTPSPSPSANVTPSPETPLVAVTVAEIAGEKMTVYLLDRDYEGSVHISFGDYLYTGEGRVKDALVMLKSTYTTQTNGAGTIRVSREYPEEYWTLSNLITGDVCYMRAESKNTFDLSYKNCGAIYFKGDVTSLITVY